MSDEVKVLGEHIYDAGDNSQERVIEYDDNMGALFQYRTWSSSERVWSEWKEMPAEWAADSEWWRWEMLSLASLLATRTRELEEARRALVTGDLFVRWAHPTVSRADIEHMARQVALARIEE